MAPASTALSKSSAVVKTVAVLGAGKLSAALVPLLSKAGHQVRLWSRQPHASAARNAGGGIDVSTHDTIAAACCDVDAVCFAVPVSALAEVARQVGDVVRGDEIALHACRGVTSAHHAGACLLPHQVLRAHTCLKMIVALGGALDVSDAASGRPLVAVAASRFDEALRTLGELVANTSVRLHATHDVIGVELAGAISHVATVAAGIAWGLGFGDTDQGILMTRGVGEAQRLGLLLGADAATFRGLAGLGDLIPRSVASTQRQRAFGHAIAMTGRVGPIGDLEGPTSALLLSKLAQRLRVELPLVNAVSAIVHDGADAKQRLLEVLMLGFDDVIPMTVTVRGI